MRTMRELVAEAQGWISDCQWAEEDLDVDLLSDEEVRRGVARHYFGGWDQFVADSQAFDVPVTLMRRFPGNARQQAIIQQLDQTVGVAGTTWMQDSDCEKPVEVRTCTMATYLIQPDGSMEVR